MGVALEKNFRAKNPPFLNPRSAPEVYTYGVIAQAFTICAKLCNNVLL